MAKAPAFQFYAADFYVGTLVMTNEQVGAYIRLLCYQWAHGFIPENTTEMASILRENTRKTRSIWNEIESKFNRNEDGTFVNTRMEEVRQAQESNRVKYRNAGIKGAEARHKSQCDRTPYSPSSLLVLSSTPLNKPQTTTAETETTLTGTAGFSIEKFEVVRLVEQYESDIASKNLTRFVSTLAVSGYDPVRVWASAVQARGKKNPSGYLVKCLTSPKYTVADSAWDQAKKEMRLAGYER